MYTQFGQKGGKKKTSNRQKSESKVKHLKKKSKQHDKVLARLFFQFGVKRHRVEKGLFFFSVVNVVQQE